MTTRTSFVFLSSSFVRMSREETFVVADTCAEADGALDRARGRLYHQFVAIACTDGMEALQGWYTDYARRCGATVSDKGRVTMDTIPEEKRDAFVKARNSFSVAKNTLTKAASLTDKIIPIVDDGGSVFLDGNGMPRSRNDILGLIAKASAADDAQSSQLSKALASLANAVRQASKLDDADLATFLSMAREQMEALATADADDAE
jgi:hypothetical protein